MSIGPGSNLGQYRIVEKLGRGGMATVYRAYQPSLDREVAIKVLPSFYAEDPAYLERFRQEARAIARLDHPNILHVYDFGDESGVTYIVSQFVPGGTLAGKLGSPLPLEYALSILKPIASALDYAHSRGVIHRDVKPQNVLLSLQGSPILSDFGIARMVEGSRLTESGLTVGTPEYMAPEQALGEATPACDVYALGVVLYEMVTGRVPFSADTPMAVVLAHMHSPLPLPHTLNPDLPGSVQSVILKSLAKRPEDRFGSASEMVEALEKAVAEAQPPDLRAVGEPGGRPVGVTQPAAASPDPASVVVSADGAPALPREARTHRRLPKLVGIGIRRGGALALAALALLASGVMLWTSQREQYAAAGQKSLPSIPTAQLPPTAVPLPLATTEAPSPAALLPTGTVALPSRTATRVLAAVAAAPPAATPAPPTATVAPPTATPVRPTPTAVPPTQTSKSVVSVENAARVGLRTVLSEGHGMVFSLAFSPDGRFLASGEWGVRMWNVRSGKTVRWWGPPPPGGRSIAFSPDGRTLAFGGEEKTIRLADVESGAELRTLSGHGGKVMSVAFTPDGDMVVSGGGDGTIKLWDPRSGKQLRSLSHPNGAMIALSPDGATLASASGVGGDAVRLWDVASGKQLRSFGTVEGSGQTCIAFSPDGRILAAGYVDGKVRLWEASNGSLLRSFGQFGSAVTAVAFSPDGAVLVSGDRLGVLTIWATGSGQELRAMADHTEEIRSVAFSPDGTAIASGNSEKAEKIRLWEVASP